MDVARIREISQVLKTLAGISFEIEEFRTVLGNFGWFEVEPEWGDPDCGSILCARTEGWFAPFITEFVQERMGGIALAILVDDEAAEGFGIVHNEAEFDEVYHTVLTGVTAEIGRPHESGTYESSLLGCSLHYAVWRESESFLVLVQHQEGDANYGNLATLDLRVIPSRGNAELPQLPLETNLIF